MDDKLKRRYVLTLFILVLFILVLSLALFSKLNAGAKNDPGDTYVATELMTYPDKDGTGAIDYPANADKRTGKFYDLEYDKVAKISLETIIESYDNPEMSTGLKQTLMRYTVKKGEADFDELFEYINSFTYKGIKGGQFWEGKEQDYYDWPFGIRIIPEPNSGESVKQNPYNAWALREADSWYYTEDKEFFIKLDKLIEEKGTVIGPYKDADIDEDIPVQVES